MSSPAASPAPLLSEEAERLKKEAKKARKAEKKAKKVADAAAETTTATTATAMDTSNSGSSEETEEQRKARKAAKKAAKAEKLESAANAALAASSGNHPSTASAAAAAASPLTPARKNYYVQHREVGALTAAAVAAVRAEHKMTLTGNTYGKDDLYKPVQTFAQAGLPAALLKCTEGFKAPSPIQAQAWPVLLMGRDAIAIAQTGSGKTLGFLLPALVHVLDAAPITPPRKGKVENAGPIVLVLAPTRELAMQSAEVAVKAAGAVQLNTCCIYGGVDRHQQRAELSKGVHVMIATPGRLLSLIKDGEVSLARVTFLVLDEADRMLDLGFEEDVRALVNYCPNSQKRQTLMFSATWPEAVRKLADTFIVDPLRIVIGKDEAELNADTLAANKRIVQSVEVIDEFKRDGRLVQLMQEHTKGNLKDHKKILVFVLYKKEVDKVDRLLRGKGFNSVGMSSDKSQNDRISAIENFKTGKTRVLVATDVAGRGLDINDIALVINYSFPLTVEDYVHRIGRTGRGGKSGESVTFFTKNDKNLSGELINVLREANANVPEELMKFGTGVKRKAHGMYGAFYKPQDDDKPMKAATKVTFD